MVRIFLFVVLCVFAASSITTADEPVTAQAAARQQLEAILAELAALQDEVDRLRRETNSTPQVLVKVKILDVDHARLAKVGFGFRTPGGRADEQPADFPAIVQRLAPTGSKPATSKDIESNTMCVLPSNHPFLAFVDMLERQQLATTLCEPNVLSYSGLPTSFRSGGEFPLSAGEGNDSSMKFYGMGISCLSQVQAHNRMQISFRAAFSQLDPMRSITIAGRTIPGLQTSELETSFTANPGETFVAASMNQRRAIEVRRGQETRMFSRLYLVTPQLVHSAVAAGQPKADAVRR